MERRIKVADGIKVANQLTLRGGEHSGLSGWAQCNQSVLTSGGRRQERVRETVTMEASFERCQGAGFEDGGYESRNVSCKLER